MPLLENHQGKRKPNICGCTHTGKPEIKTEERKVTATRIKTTNLTAEITLVDFSAEQGNTRNKSWTDLAEAKIRDEKESPCLDENHPRTGLEELGNPPKHVALGDNDPDHKKETTRASDRDGVGRRQNPGARPEAGIESKGGGNWRTTKSWANRHVRPGAQDRTKSRLNERPDLEVPVPENWVDKLIFLLKFIWDYNWTTLPSIPYLIIKIKMSSW
jgi:hypothetical protein